MIGTPQRVPRWFTVGVVALWSLGVFVPATVLAARGASPAAFGGRCIPAGCVAPPSNIPDILGRRASPAGRLARLGATPDFHHGLLAQHGPGRHDTSQEGPAYDTKTEATFTGTVTDVETGGPGRLGWLMRVHTLGPGHKGVQEKQLLLKTDTDTVRIHLGPTAFLTDQKVEITKGDTLDVTGSRVTIGQSQLVLAREIRKADNTWTLRDVAGQPLWRAAQTEERGFWTTKKVLLTVVVVKVALLFTVLRH